MIALPTGPRGSLLALGFTAVVVACLWVGVARPLIASYEDGAEILRQRAALARRMAEVAETLPSLQRQATTAAATAPSAAALLDGGSEAIAGARLQELVQAMAQDAGIALDRVETLPVELRGAYTRIGLRLALSADWPALIRLLQTLGQASPRILVDDLQLRSTGAAIGANGAHIDASLSVFAFWAAGSRTAKQ